MRFIALGYSVLGVAMLAGSAHAGGFSRGTADTDILFEPGQFNIRAGAAVVVPHQEFTAAPAAAPTPGLVGTNYLDTYVIPSVAMKFSFNDNLSCAGTYTDTNGAASTHAVPYGLGGKLKEEFTTEEYGATCAVFFDVGPGRLAVLGGGFVERFDYSLTAQPIITGGAPLGVGLDSTAYGWRAGVAYEIPDIALRAQLLYRSGTSHDATGSAASPLFPIPLAATGSGELPQSVELKVQSGIAPGWLAFGSVKWMDWSVNETLAVNIQGVPTPLLNQYYWRDGWTITGGIGHTFNERVSGLVSLQWDRGVSTGYDFRSDKWMLAGAASIKDSIGGELRFGAGVTYLSSAAITEATSPTGGLVPDYGAAVDSGWAGIFTAAYSITW